MFYLYSLKLRAWYCGGTLRGLKFVVRWGTRADTHMQLAVFRDQKDAEDTAAGLTDAENGAVMVRPLSVEADVAPPRYPYCHLCGDGTNCVDNWSGGQIERCPNKS